jgi:hypothetical protein
MSIDIDTKLIDPTVKTGRKRPEREEDAKRRQGRKRSKNIFSYVEDNQNGEQEKEITAILEAISEAETEAETEAKAEDETEDTDELTQSYLYDNPERITSPTAMIVDTNAKYSFLELNLDQDRLETIAVVRCHGDILSPMSIFFNNPALTRLKPLMENTRLIVSGGYPGLTVVSQGICGPNSRIGGCLEGREKAKTNCSDGFLNTIAGFNAIVDVAKGYGDLNKDVNFDALINAGVNPADILGDYNQTNLVHCLYFSADPEAARLKIKTVIENTEEMKIDDTVSLLDTYNTMMMILDPEYKQDDFSACDIISVTDQTQKITLIYNNETDENDIFDINNLKFYSKLKYFFKEDLLKKDDADEIMRPFVLKLKLWVHKFVTEWNRLIIHYVENTHTQELYGDIRFLLKLENLVVLMDTNKQTITYSNTFVQNILIMSFGKWLFGVYQYLQNQNKEFMTEFMSIFEFDGKKNGDYFVTFCENIRNLLGNTENPRNLLGNTENPRNLLGNRENVVKVIGNFCQGYNKRVYPDTNDIVLKEYIEQQKRTIKTLWVKAGTRTLADYEANQIDQIDLNNYKTAGEVQEEEEEETAKGNSNNYLENRSNSNNSNTYPGNPYQENRSNSSNSNSNNSRWGGKPKSKKQRRQSKKQRRQSKKQRRQSKKQRRQGNKRNKYTVKRRW